MPHSGRRVHIDRPLSNMAIGYKPEGMIVDQLAPIIPVQKQSDGFYVWDQSELFRTEDDKRAPGTEANVLTRSLSSDTFFCKNYALKDRVPYEDIENSDAKQIFFERGVRAEGIKDTLMLNWENRTAAQVTNTSNVGSSSAVGSAWTDYTNSDPIADILTAMNNVEDLTGYRPNSIAMSGTAWRHFRENSEVISRVFGNQTSSKGRVVSREQAAALFEVDRFIIAGAYKNGSEENQTLSLTRIWGDHCLIYYAPLTARKDKPSFMYSFRWTKIMNMQAKVFQLPKAEAEEVQLGYYQDEKITSANLGFLVTNVTSST